MSLSVVYTRANLGIDAPLVTIEVHLSNGMPAFQLVGLPETSVKESKDRVRSALINAGFEFPSKRITVNMAPADLPKGGGRFDLAIAIGIIAASEEIPEVQLQEFEFVGELALSGELRSIQGALPMAFAAKQSKRQLVLPQANANEAALVSDAGVLSANTLFDVYLHLTGKRFLSPATHEPSSTATPQYGDLSEIIDQQHAKRALEITASAGHNLLFYGPAGTGKSMLASRLLSIMPDLDEEDALVVASIRSISGDSIHADNWRTRPFRQPHHSSSAAALVGGGTYPKPGEITLAHKGVLFLDELPEFGRHVLDVMREPLETGVINLSRATHKVTYPADFQLIAAMNPSPTGDIDDKRANNEQILRYLNRISGPLIDRIDLQVSVPRVNLESTLNCSDSQRGEVSRIVKDRVLATQRRQLERQGRLNAALTNDDVRQHCSLSPSNQRYITQAMDALGLSMRAYHRTLKVARTIADMQGVTEIQEGHITEALSYRSFDRMLHQLTSN
ncbi:YifB family Mg chelatase-like AAA ATPase [Glaciecola sp. XM2]|uniref:YifB family Mg chelatase-like AAA ATPase n=1 Tax=Glaciecola sp. XM2 TaxID=1914931 RepID=UPI001BDDF6E4|nr:YifB family Mg chelatase-like AAA ATPase [Glaciecola sp. XM2]MBT1451465.1 YifB family Mg chelatase-like AAA ATPase [Glaciecola sp. XM2]